MFEGKARISSHFAVHFSLVTQLCLTLCNPWTAARQASLSITNSRNLLKLVSIKSVMPCNHLILCHPLLLPPSIFPSIRVFSNESAKSCLTLAVRWTVALQAPLSVRFPRQEYWSELAFPSSGDLPDPGIEPPSPALAGRFFTAEPSKKRELIRMTSVMAENPGTPLVGGPSSASGLRPSLLRASCHQDWLKSTTMP